jgi:hypothetical protein
MKLLFFLVLVLPTILAIRSFSATISKGYNFEGKSNGFGRATGSIQFNGANANNLTMSITWNLPSGAIRDLYIQLRLLDGSTQNIKNKICATQCSAQTLNKFPDYDPANTANWQTGTVSGYSNCWQRKSTTGLTFDDPYRICTQTSAASSNLVYIELYAPNQISGSGTKMELTGYSGSPGTINPRPSTCPSPTCNAQAEIIFVVDSSASIDSNEWASLTNFLNQTVHSFIIGNDGVRVGFLYFSGSSQQLAWATSPASLTSIVDRIYSPRPFSGNTDIEKGMKSSVSVLNTIRNTPPSRNVQRIMIVVTDGDCCCYITCDLTGAHSYCINNGYNTIFAVGVGGGISQISLLQIAGCDQVDSSWRTISDCTSHGGVEGARSCQCPLNVAGYSALKTVVDQLVTVTCSTLNDAPFCDCSSGLCGCNASPSNPDCLCPQCDDPNVCYTYGCTSSGQCTQTPVPIDDGNACTTDSCDPVTGVHHTTVTCPDDGSGCTQAVCDQKTGCYQKQLCVSTNPCVATTCTDRGMAFPNSCSDSPSNCSACVADINCLPSPSTCTPKVCPDAPCKNGKCDSTISCPVGIDPNCNCILEDVACPGSICRPGVCDVNANNGQGGCVYNTNPCDDGNACTKDICTENGNSFSCSYTDITCDDNDLCTIDSCDTQTGCVYTLKECPDETPCNVLKGCNSANGVCLYETRDCVSELQKLGVLGGCQIASCSDTPRHGKAVINKKQVEAIFPPGCYPQQTTAVNTSSCVTDPKTNETTCKQIKEDACGVCGGDGSTCGLGISIGAAAGIAAGVLAGIIIAVIAACLIVSAVGGKVGMDYYRKYKGNMGQAQNNPLYQGKEAGGVNPLYDEEPKS